MFYERVWDRQPPPGVPLDPRKKSGIAVYYALNEAGGDLYDLSGNRNKGIRINEPIWKAGVLEFPGTDEYVDIDDTNNDTLDMGTHDMTLLAWIKPGDKTAFILNKRDVSGEVGYDMFFNNTNPHVTARIGDGATELASSSANDSVPIGVWSYISAVYDRDANLTIYVNGVASGTPTDITSKAASQTNTHNFTIGDRNQVGNHLYFLGQMKQVIVFNQAITPAEITQLAVNPWHGHEPIRIPLGVVAAANLSPIYYRTLLQGDRL